MLLLIKINLVSHAYLLSYGRGSVAHFNIDIMFGEFYIDDKEAYFQECIVPIINNTKLDKFDPDIRQSWIEIAVVMRVDKLYNTDNNVDN